MTINDYGKKNITQIDPSSSTKNCWVNFKGDFNSVVIGKGCKIENLILDLNGNYHRVVIGNRVTLYGDAVTFEDEGGLFSVGDDSLMFHHLCVGVVEKGRQVSIGKGCLFSNTIRIRTSDSHSILDINTKARVNAGKDIIIGDRVWICENVHILKGAHIQNDSVVGACSVVTDKLFPPNSVIVGNPAKVIKTGIYWITSRT